MIVRASGKALMHPKLVCVYNNEWTEVHWNTETKTYSLGASIPQLDEYDTEGSDVQVLINKELEKTSEEDTTSEAESEEELKEPGPSINQQIHLTPIAQSLKASPTDTKSNPLTSEAAMTTHTATYTSTAITSSQPVLTSSSTQWILICNHHFQPTLTLPHPPKFPKNPLTMHPPLSKTS